MQGPQIPEILKQRLRFGDEEQIKALRDYENKVANYFGGDGEKRWAVTIEVDGVMTTYITATTKEEAEQKCMDETDLSLSDFDVSFSARPASN